MSHFKSSLLNIAFFKEQQFLIPAYQRPYVWGDTQIKKLLRDFWDAFDRDENEIYYLGTVVTAQNEKEEEIIDGQQRLTTLWLIALAFERLGIQSGLSSFLQVNNKVRLRFEIRIEVQIYLQTLADNPAGDRNFSIPPELLQEQPYLRGIAHAAEIIYKDLPQYFTGEAEIKAGLADFAKFIATRVMFVKNTAPTHTDLKKLFTTLNNSGIQLEQADILKSRLLERIKTEKLRYSKIWESCENMDNYFEHNVKACFQNAEGLTAGQFAMYDADLFYTADGENSLSGIVRKVSLFDILQSSDESGEMNPVKTLDGREVVCESIISLPQLLLHTLRIHLKEEMMGDFLQPFHSNNLLETFELIRGSDEENIKTFFKLLWRVRYAFDKHVVKWVEKNGERVLGFRPVTAELIRGPIGEKSALSMMQSMLYFTGNYNTQMWLSPYLKSMLEGKAATMELERIDNYLSLSSVTDKQVTWDLMSDVPLVGKINYSAYLEGDWSTRFKHYWFYKLEYILWKSWPKELDSQFLNYRITSKNSVEHICSQKDEYGRKLYNHSGKFLGDSFGNLTLLSVSQNSGYGNQDTGKKFIDHQKKSTYDSLKLARFFQLCGSDVTGEKVETHRREMIELLDRHYGKFLTPKEEAEEIELITSKEMEE